jgi:anti-sigma regulatory factor (Ser/Thr protein kinase)
VTATTARPPQTPHPSQHPGWPLSSVLPPMGALLTAPRTARAHVRDILSAWGLPRFTDNAVLVASELVSNVVRQCHDPGGNPVYIDGRLPVVQLSLFSDRARLLIAVYDQAPGIPEQGHPDDNAETGRGLALIATLGTWDWYPADGGKVVRALLAAAA